MVDYWSNLGFFRVLDNPGHLCPKRMQTSLFVQWFSSQTIVAKCVTFGYIKKSGFFYLMAKVNLLQTTYFNDNLLSALIRQAGFTWFKSHPGRSHL
jgi:hypothetical protein